MSEDKSTPPQTVAVTGAGGALGASLIRLLAQEEFSVIAIDRHGAHLHPPETEVSYEERRGDLTSRRFCREAVQGADIVIHTAARNNSALSYEALVTINLEAVRWLYEAAEDCGATRFVHISSAALYSAARGVLTEETPLDPSSTFERTKAEAERFLASRHEDDLPWVILRPSLLYGPGVKTFGATLLTLPPMLRQVFPYIPGITNGPRNNWLHVDDLARATLMAATHPETPGEIFNVADDVALSYGEIFSAAVQGYGLDIGPTLPFPTGILSAIAPLVDSDILFRALTRLVEPLWMRVARRYQLEDQLHPSFHHSGLTYLLGDRMLETSKLKALGWAPSWPDLREGMTDTVRWYQDQGWVPNYQALPEKDDGEDGIGVSTREDLNGRVAWLEGAPNHHEGDFCALELTLTFPNIRRLFMDQDAHLEGRVTLDGIAERAALHGTLEIHKTRRKLVYEFGFDGDDQKPYRFRGEKNLGVFSFLQDLTSLEGTFVGSRGEEIARATLRTDPREAFSLLLRNLALK